MNITKQQIGAIFVAVLFGGSAIAYGISAAFPESKESQGPIGQAFLEVQICGEERELPTAEVKTDTGPITVNENNTVSFPVESGITLGQVFDAMNVTFSSIELMGYKNDGDMCNTTYSNEVSVSRGRTVEGMEQRLQSIDQYTTYELKHGDYIVVRYD